MFRGAPIGSFVLLVGLMGGGVDANRSYGLEDLADLQLRVVRQEILPHQLPADMEVEDGLARLGLEDEGDAEEEMALDAVPFQIEPAPVLWGRDIFGIRARLTQEPAGLTWRVIYPLIEQVIPGLVVAPEQVMLVAMGMFLRGFFPAGEDEEQVGLNIDVVSTICIFGPDSMMLQPGQENPSLMLNGLLGDSPGAFQDIYDRLVAWREALQQGDAPAVAQIRADLVQAYRLPLE